MKITVFGANGRVGSLVVEDLLKQGHEVIAFVHGSNTFENNVDLTVIQGDIYSYEDVKKALVGSSCVISALGSWGTPKKDILSEGMKNVIPAMNELGIKKIVSLTGAGCSVFGVKPTMYEKISRIPLVILAPKIVKDAESHIKQLHQSKLDWTVLRSPVMNNRGNAMSYKLADKLPMPWATINRNSVAKALIELLDNKKFINKSPYIKRS
jgi:putative NADH-flavin reductase